MVSTVTSPQAQFEGESSLSVHTAFANSLIERAVSTGPLQDCSAEMAAALEALRRLVGEQKLESNFYDTTYPRAKPDPNPSLSLDQSMMPPIHSVMAVLQTMKSTLSPSSFHNKQGKLQGITANLTPLQQTHILTALGSSCS
jgi:hypothetical protein